jgi:hypothetical protein
MQFVEYSSLASGRYGLMDASSISALERHGGTLTSKLNPESAREILSNPEEFGLSAPLLILERWIVLDHVCVDLVALDSLQDGRAAKSFNWTPPEPLRLDREADLPVIRKEIFLSHLRKELLEAPHNSQQRQLNSLSDELSISATFVPTDTVEMCLKSVSRTAQAIKEAHPEIAWGTFAFGVEKRYGEVLSQIYGRAGHLARSHLGVERTLFYYEAAGMIGAPVLLHPDRSYEAQAINGACQDAFDAVKKVVSRSFEEPVRSQLYTLGFSHDLPLPPLAFRLVRLAGERSLSIVEAAKTIKESSEARAFRRWLSEVQECLKEGTMDAKLRVLRLFQELERVASSWTDELDVTHGISYRKRRIELSKVPRIGAILMLLDGVSIRDPILNQKGYLTFVSSWYR